MNDLLNQVAQDEHDTNGLVAFVAAEDYMHTADLFARLQRGTVTLERGGGKKAKEWLAGHCLPKIMLVDLAGEAYPQQSIVELSEICGPGTRIIALGEVQDVDFYREVLQAGAIDYLLKPVRLSVLASAIERAESGLVLGEGGQWRGGRTVALFGATGGAGVSTLTAALGRVITSQHHSACALVDFDRNKSDLPLLLGADADSGLDAVMAASEIDPRLLQRSLQKLSAELSDGVPQRLYLLSQRPGGGAALDPERVLELGGALAQLFSLTLWDLPACHRDGVPEVIDHADVRILLCDLNVLHARHVHRLVQRFGDERAGQRLLLVLNPTRAASGLLTKGQFEDFVERKIDLSLPHVGTSLTDSLLNGPLDLKSNVAYAQAVLTLADRLLGRKPQKGIQDSPYWLARLLPGLHKRPSYF